MWRGRHGSHGLWRRRRRRVGVLGACARLQPSAIAHGDPGTGACSVAGTRSQASACTNAVAECNAISGACPDSHADAYYYPDTSSHAGTGSCTHACSGTGSYAHTRSDTCPGAVGRHGGTAAQGGCCGTIQPG